jgi:MoxR-like ATPase
MAKNESLAVLHATLDFRRIIDVPGYDRIELAPCTRFIATMNYGYAGTREINEALASRFMVINMPIISVEDLQKLLKAVPHPHRRSTPVSSPDCFGSCAKSATAPKYPPRPWICAD